MNLGSVLLAAIWLGSILLASWIERRAYQWRVAFDNSPAVSETLDGDAEWQSILARVEDQFVVAIRQGLLHSFATPIERSPEEIRERVQALAGAMNCGRFRIYCRMEHALRGGAPFDVVWFTGMLEQGGNTDVGSDA